jgi:hypothetical protein
MADGATSLDFFCRKGNIEYYNMSPYDILSQLLSGFLRVYRSADRLQNPALISKGDQTMDRAIIYQ